MTFELILFFRTELGSYYVFLQRTPLTEITSIGDMRRNVGNLAGALHAYEVAEKAAQELTLDNFLIVINIPRFSRDVAFFEITNVVCTGAPAHEDSGQPRRSNSAEGSQGLHLFFHLFPDQTSVM